MYGYSAIIAAVRFLPVGIAAGFIPPIISKLATFTPAKRIILGSLTLTFIGTILLPFADQKNRYWSLVFPGFIIGTIGTMGVYIINRLVLIMTNAATYVLNNLSVSRQVSRFSKQPHMKSREQ
jgi:hypothetical protein